MLLAAIVKDTTTRRGLWISSRVARPDSCAEPRLLAVTGLMNAYGPATALPSRDDGRM